MMSQFKCLSVVALAMLLANLLVAPSTSHASGGAKTWPIATAPVPVPGTIILNSEKKVVTTTTNTVAVALAGLDASYLSLGWTLGAAVNEPRTYTKVINGKKIKIIVFFAALDPTPTNGGIRAQFTQTWNQL